MYNLQCDHTSMLKSGCPRHVLQLESSELQVGFSLYRYNRVLGEVKVIHVSNSRGIYCREDTFA